MYDMTGFDYDITDVANLLRLHKRRGNYYDCPFCGDTKGRLNINPAKNVFRCNRCDKSGGMLQLYADLHNLTYRGIPAGAPGKGTGRKGRACAVEAGATG